MNPCYRLQKWQLSVPLHLLLACLLPYGHINSCWKREKPQVCITMLSLSARHPYWQDVSHQCLHHPGLCCVQEGLKQLPHAKNYSGLTLLLSNARRRVLYDYRTHSFPFFHECPAVEGCLTPADTPLRMTMRSWLTRLPYTVSSRTR